MSLPSSSSSLSSSCHLFPPAAFSLIRSATSAWRFEGWLHQFPLTKSTVLDYFKHSNFYDRSCNNEKVQYNSGKLRSLTGLEYEIENSNSPQEEFYFLIKKQFRQSPNKVEIIELYFCIGIEAEHAQQPARGTIFQLPPLQSVLLTHLITAQYYANEALESLKKQVKFQAGKGYQWKQIESTITGESLGRAANSAFNSLVEENLRKIMENPLEKEEKTNNLNKDNKT